MENRVPSNMNSITVRPKNGAHFSDHLEFQRMIFGDSQHVARSPRHFNPINSKIHILNFPVDFLLGIFHFLDLRSLIITASVCRHWHEVALRPLRSLFQDSHNMNCYKYNEQIIALEAFTKVCRNLKTFSYDFRPLEMFKERKWTPKENYKYKYELSVLTDRIIKLFQACCGEKLTDLRLDFLLNDDIFYLIGKCTQLIKLDLTRTLYSKSSQYSFDYLLDINKLEFLSLFQVKTNDRGLIELLKVNPNLKSLTLCECPNLRKLDDILETVAENNPQITTLHFCENGFLTLWGTSLFAKCANLIELSLSISIVPKKQEPRLYIKKIAENCPHLQILDINGWNNMTDKDLLPILSLKQITTLDISYIRSITIDIVTLIIQNLKNLNMLKLLRNKGIYRNIIWMGTIELLQMQYRRVTIIDMMLGNR